MKKRIAVILLVVLAVVIPAAAFADIGIGGVAGYDQPSGLSFKLDDFPVVSLGWSVSGDYVHGTVDYWFINDRLEHNFLWYLGGGVKASLGSNFGLGLRVPIGVQWYFIPRFELFAEIVPGFDILPASGFDISGGIGLRFHF